MCLDRLGGVSTSYLMIQDPSRLSTKSARQIVGFSLSPELAAAVKMEAARRDTTLKKLFEEMWAMYISKKSDHARKSR